MNWLKKTWKALSEPAPRGQASLEPRTTTHTLEIAGNFTPRAQQLLALARKEADRFNHNFLGTEHLLLGLVALGQGTAVNVLQKMGLDLETVRMEIEKQVGTGPDQKMISTIPYTPRVRKVLALAAKEAKALNHTYVGTEHILLGLLREGDGVAARVLKNLDVDVEKTRQEILKELDPNSSRDDQTNRKEAAMFPNLEPNERDLLDINKRYDVYCAERNQDVVVYRNALFKGDKKLFQRNQYDYHSDFVELEQANGQIICVVKSSIIKFCEPGVTPNAESVSSKKS